MRASQEAIVARLEKRLSDVLRGQSLKTWAEGRTAELLETSNQHGPPLLLETSSPLLKKRRIKRVSYKVGLPERGRLSIESDGFAIEVAPTSKRLGQWSRFVLAHELAHSLFFNVEEWPPLPLISFEPGNRDLEWLCWYLAKCLLVPSRWVLRELSHKPTPDSDGFSFSILYRLEKLFSAPWRIIAQRLVEDLNLWNCAILQFTKLPDRAVQDGSVSSWYLAWQTRPITGAEGLFIPIGRRENGVMKFPSAKGTLAEFISDCFERGLQESNFSAWVSHETLNAGATGNLKKFIADEPQIGFHCSVNTYSQHSIFDFPNSRDLPDSVTLCVPLCPTKWSQQHNSAAQEVLFDYSE